MSALILAFDTSGPHCAAALVRGDEILVSRAEEMARGQAERLMPLLQATLQSAGLDWSDLDRIAVGVGPGNFTGIRIGVSAARGLALGLGIPCIGVSAFEVIHFCAPDAMAAVEAPRAQAYLCSAGGTPELRPMADAVGAQLPPKPQLFAERIAAVALTKPAGPRPAPLYIRPADAAPSKEHGPVMLDG